MTWIDENCHWLRERHFNYVALSKDCTGQSRSDRELERPWKAHNKLTEFSYVFTRITKGCELAAPSLRVFYYFVEKG